MFQPTTFGKYFLTRRIAIGGMAEVYAAKLYGADGFEKDLVIKQILPQHARDPEFVQSFVAEAKIAVGLTHANIVTIYELGRVDGTYFIAMELVNGLDAFALLEAARRHGRTVPVASAVRIAREVARGLDYAHRRIGPDGRPLGLVHRDLNPRNVLVSREGDAKILDFGIAKTAPGVTDMPKTRAGVVKGTSGYMSPEQAMGREIDARTDIYQAGLLLYELLTGGPLFWRPDDEETRNLMRAHQVVPPSVLRPEVPPEVDRAVLDALAREPHARIQTAAELVDTLDRVIGAAPGPSDAASIGALVTELMALDAQAVADAGSDDSPDTRDLSEVISQAIEQVTGQVETFAQAPGLPEPYTRPTTGSTPIELEHGTAPPQVLLTSSGELVPQAEQSRDVLVPQEVVSAVVTDPPNRQGRRGRAGALAALLLLAGAGAFVALSGGEDEPAPARAEAPAARASEPAPPPEPAETASASAVAQADPAPPAAVLTTRRPTPAPAPAPPARGNVAFGTRSCSSRVSVDGKLVAKSTPSFDHWLSTGPHTILVEGTSCPAIERPGSLRRVQPSVSGRIDVEAGARLKVIADFDRERLIVRKED